MSGAVFLQVVLRFLGLTGIDGLEEVPRYLFVWLVMIGAAVGHAARRAHRARLFHQSPRARAAARWCWC